MFAIRSAVRRVATAGRTFATQAAKQATSNNGRRAAAAGIMTAAGFALATTYKSTTQPIEAAAATQKAPIAGVKGTPTERSFIAIKPDGVQRGLVGEVIKRFEARGYKLVAMKVMVPSKALAEQHYADLRGRPFYPGLVDYMTNGKAPVVAMVWQGLDVIRQGRKLIGATNPLEALRADFCVSTGRNVIHGSDSYESANTEIALWFNESEIFDWAQANASWIVSAN